MSGRTQADRLLELLKDRGPAGVLNIEMHEIAFRYSARLLELRNDGHRIRATHVRKSIWRFTLLESA